MTFLGQTQVILLTQVINLYGKRGHNNYLYDVGEGAFHAPEVD